MNNYVLNNTSVYLGGQCRWDIIVDAYSDGELEIKGFQLTPLATNVPYNKKRNTNLVNTNHSENLKKYYNSIKKNFWSINPDSHNLNRYDRSCIRGLKRLPQYKLYNKQFGYLLPIWLEKIEEGKHLEFEFIASTSAGKQIDSCILRLKSDEALGYTHNKFCEYIENWFKYTNIIPKYDDEKGILNGNDKVLNIDLANSTAQIYGINVTTGQISNDISVDDVIANILQQERPLMETDYILSTLFKNHNIILTQLFNLNFCFNFEDIISPALINMMLGGDVSIDCMVWLCDNENRKQLDFKRLYTNYEFVPREISDPYLILTDGIISLSDHKTPVIKDDKTPIDGYSEEEKNVLNYLKDYSDPGLININKLSQPIIHWSYLDNSNKTFNVYEGFDSVYTNIKGSGNDKKRSISYVSSSNGISILDFPTTYKGNMNELTWLYPSKLFVLYPDGELDCNRWLLNIKKYIPFYWDNYGMTLENCANFWGVNIKDIIDNDSDVVLSKKLLVIKTNDPNVNRDFFNMDKFIDIIDGSKFVSAGNIDGEHLIVFTNDNKYLLIQNLIDAEQTPENILQIFLNFIKNIITKGNEGNYIGFGKELGVGEDELGNQVYFKMSNKSVFPNRKSGKLRPLMTSSIDYVNYTYKYIPQTGMIEKFDNEFDPLNPNIHNDNDNGGKWYEFLWSNGDNSHIVLLNRVEETYYYDINRDNEESVKKSIIQCIKDVYRVDNEVANYIYGLYKKDYFYEYDKYEGKCVLNLK